MGSKGVTMQVALPLDDVLAHPVGLKLLTKFSRRERSEEGLIFCLEVLRLRDLYRKHKEISKDSKAHQETAAQVSIQARRIWV